MFENIGGKIKGLAEIICKIGIALSIITAVIMFIIAANSYDDGFLIIFAIIILIIGPLSSWIGSFFMYGFGELIEKTCEIAKNTSTNTNQNTPSTSHSKLSSIPSINQKNSAIKKPISKDWICSKCGEKNTAHAISCKNCGNYK